MLPANTESVATQSSAFQATKSRTWAFSFTQVHPLMPASLPKMCAAAKGMQARCIRAVRGIPEVLSETRENVLQEASLLPEMFITIILCCSPFNYIPQSKEKSRLRKRLNWRCPCHPRAFVSIMNALWAVLLG